jgi:hypothetical protein
MADDRPPSKPCLDPGSLSSLAATTMAALYNADMVVVMEVFRARVLNRGADRLFDQVRGRDGRFRLQYKPMVELLLLHAHDIAASDAPRDERESEILWALEASGF